MGLCITRRAKETVVIGNPYAPAIVIEITDIGCGKVGLNISAHPSIKILRGEVARSVTHGVSIHKAREELRAIADGKAMAAVEVET